MRWHYHRHHHRHIRVALIVNGEFAVELTPNGVIHMAATINVGQTLPLSIAYLDQGGQPMASTPFADAPPAWSHTDATVSDLTAAADGNTASVVGLASGADTITLSVLVGGKSFNATLSLTVAAVMPPPQVLTSIEIVADTPSL